jgi:hypothetical protein
MSRMPAFHSINEKEKPAANRFITITVSALQDATFQ